MAHLTNFSFDFFYEILTEDASLRLLDHSANKSKMTKNSTQGGPHPEKVDSRLKHECRRDFEQTKKSNCGISMKR